jgi:hypothetical protein
MMRRDSALLFIAHAIVNHAIHALNELVRGKAGLRVDRATQLAINHIAHALQDAAHEALGQNRVTSSLRGWILFVCHDSEYD